MNREIKFRAFHYTSGMRFFTLDQVDAGMVLFDDGDRRSLKDCEVMQYTGLKGKDGREIYEGDIVTFPWVNAGIPALFSIGFSEGCFKIIPVHQVSNGEKVWECILTHGEYKKVEVIGNIYENPELIQ